MLKIITLTDEARFSSNSYLLITENSVSVIDPSVAYEAAVLQVSEISKLKPAFVILTHGHIDHIWEIDSYVRAGFKVLVHSADAKMLSDINLNCSATLFGKACAYLGEYQTVEDGELIDLFGVSVRVLWTPGHTDGSVCYIGDNFIFTGDTLFANGGYGRFDLPTGSAAKLASSLKKLFEFEDNMTIYPGHGCSSSLGQTKSFF